MAIGLRKRELCLEEIVFWFGVAEEKLLSGYKWNMMGAKTVSKVGGI